MFVDPKNRNEGTKNRTTAPKGPRVPKNRMTVCKTGTRAHSPKPPFYKTVLFPIECCLPSHSLKPMKTDNIRYAWASGKADHPFLVEGFLGLPVVFLDFLAVTSIGGHKKC